MGDIKIESREDLETAVSTIHEEIEGLKTVKGTVDSLAATNQERQEKVDSQLEGLAKQVGDLTLLFKQNWEDRDDDEGMAYKWGKWFYALKRGDVKTLLKMGSQKLDNIAKDEVRVDKQFMDQATKMIESGRMGAIDDPEGKTDFGTPLMGDGGSGQYTLPANIYADDLFRIMEEQSDLIPKLTNIPMSGRQIIYPVEGTSFSFTARSSESGDTTETNPTFSQATLTANTYAGWVGMSDELMEDTFLEIGNLLRTQAAEALMNMIEEKIIDCNNDDSLSVYGVLHDTGGVNEVIMDSTSFDDVSWDDMKELRQALSTKKLRRGGYYILHPTVMDELASRKDAVGRWYFDPATGMPRSIWGYPYILSDNAPESDDSAVSTSFVAFGNPKYLYHGTRLGLTFGFYPGTYYKVQNLENFFLAVTRQAFDVPKPGAFAKLTTAAS